MTDKILNDPDKFFSALKVPFSEHEEKAHMEGIQKRTSALMERRRAGSSTPSTPGTPKTPASPDSVHEGEYILFSAREVRKHKGKYVDLQADEVGNASPKAPTAHKRSGDYANLAHDEVGTASPRTPGSAASRSATPTSHKRSGDYAYLASEAVDRPLKGSHSRPGTPAPSSALPPLAPKKPLRPTPIKLPKK
jgi:hypothetical protein